MNKEVLGIYNELSGKGLATDSTFAAAGLTSTVSFREVIKKPEDYIDLAGQKIVVAGGDGTNFSILSLLAEQGLPTAHFTILALGAGTENVFAQQTNTLVTHTLPQETINLFIRDQLPTHRLRPFSFSDSCENTSKEPIGFWSLNGGIFANSVLDYLARERKSRNTHLRNFMATLTALQEKWFADSYAIARTETTISGRDLVFLRSQFPNQFPNWTRKIKSAELCEPPPENGQDILLRIGKPTQTKIQAFAGFLLDMCMLQLHLQPRTGTLSAVPVAATDDRIMMTFPTKIVTKDSELVTLSTKEVVINRVPRQKFSALQLAYQPIGK